MSISLTEYGKELINKIQVAGSQEEVKGLIDRSLKNLEQSKGDAEKVARFVETSITHLANLNPMNKDANQWSNINMARIHFQHIKRESELTLCK